MFFFLLCTVVITLVLCYLGTYKTKYTQTRVYINMGTHINIYIYIYFISSVFLRMNGVPNEFTDAYAYSRDIFFYCNLQGNLQCLKIKIFTESQI